MVDLLFEDGQILLQLPGSVWPNSYFLTDGLKNIWSNSFLFKVLFIAPFYDLFLVHVYIYFLVNSAAPTVCTFISLSNLTMAIKFLFYSSSYLLCVACAPTFHLPSGCPPWQSAGCAAPPRGWALSAAGRRSPSPSLPAAFATPRCAGHASRWCPRRSAASPLVRPAAPSACCFQPARENGGLKHQGRLVLLM